MIQRLDHLSDEELMMQTRSNDVQAFETLVRRHYTRLALYITHVLGNAECAEDLAQETFLRVFCARARYVPKARWVTWLRKIALNLSRDERRRRIYAPVCSLDESVYLSQDVSLSLHESIPDPHTTPADALLCQEETRDELRRGLEGLSSRHAQVLKMRVYEDMNYREIAESLGCSLGTVKSRIHYAVRELRVRLVQNKEEGEAHLELEDDGSAGSRQ